MLREGIEVKNLSDQANASIYLVHHIVITIRNKALQQSDSRHIPNREYIPIWLKSHAFSTDIRSFAICTISFDFATCTRMSENIREIVEKRPY